MIEKMCAGTRIAFIALLAPSLGLQAQEARDTGERSPQVIEEVRVIGILPDRLDAFPGSFALIDGEDLKARRPVSNLERMRMIPGINVVADGSMGFDTNIGFRGQNPRRSAKAMIMEDGVPLQLAPYTDPVVHYTTPSAVTGRIEAIKGAGQILYGPQTLGGAVNFITHPVPRAGGLEGRVSAALGNQDQRQVHGNLGIGGERGGVAVDFIQHSGDGIFAGSDFDVKDYRFKGEFDLTEQQIIGIKVVHTEDRRSQTENYLTRDEYARDPFVHPTVELDEWEQDRDVVHLYHKVELREGLRIRSSAYYTESFRNGLRGSNSGREVNGFFESRLRNCDAVGDTNGDGNLTISDLDGADIDVCGGRHAPRSYETWGVESRADFTHELFGYENDAIVGVRYHEETAHRQQVFATNRAERLSYELALRNDSAGTREGTFLDAQALAFFAQNTLYLGDWSVTPGFRVEDVRAGDRDEFSGEEESLSYTEFLPSLGVSWNGMTGTTVFAGLHRGFSPARADREFTAEGGRAEPEESTLFELGVRTEYFEGVSASVTFFSNDIDNTVIDLGATFENSGESEQQGIELAGRIDFGPMYNSEHNVYVSGAYTNLWTSRYIRARSPEDDGNRMQYSPEHLLNLDLGYEHSSGFSARVGVQYVSDQFVDDENTREENGRGTEGIIPGFNVWSATVNYDVGSSGLGLFASVENMFDRSYLASRNEGMLPGRDRLFLAGVSYDF